MATRTKPLMSVAALATAAAVAVATPALAPSITSAAAPAISSAKVNLTTFSDLMSITAADWNNVVFNGWGGAIGPINIDPVTTQDDNWLPLCNYDCTIPGISGVTYLALDALINGNGQGIGDASNWGISAVNYFYEGGLATGVQYIVESPFLSDPVNQPCDAEGVTCGPLYNPAIANLIALGFQGTYALTTLYVTGLSILAQAASGVPYIGEYLYRGIGSYIGLPFQDIDAVYDYSYYAGISGVLRYIGGVITTGGNPNPYPVPQSSSAASTAALAAKVPAVAKVVDAPSVTAAAETATAAVSNTPAATVAETKVQAASTEATSTPAESASATAVTAVADTPAATAPATKPAAASAPSRKRPVRAAAASVAKAITSAVKGGTSDVTGGASAATTAASSAGGASAAS